MKNLVILVWLFLSAVSASAAIYRVSPDGTGTHTTINAAITASAVNDTIVIRGDLGAYTEDLSLPHTLTLIGQGNGCYGVAGTVVYGLITLQANVCSGTVIEGLYLYFAANLPVYHVDIGDGNTNVMLRRCYMYGYLINANIRVLGNSSVTVENCILQSVGNTFWVYVPNAGTVYLVNSIFANGGYLGILLESSGAYLTAINCAFVGYYGTSSIMSGSGNWTISHCVFWDVTASTVSGNVMVSYNAYPTTFTSWPGGTGDVVLTSNPFTNYNEASNYLFCTAGSPSDLHPAIASPLIDAGDPTLPGDLEGAGTATRDIGIYGGEQPMVDNGAPDFPFVTLLSVPPGVPQNGVLEIHATGRVGRGQ